MKVLIVEDSELVAGRLRATFAAIPGVAVAIAADIAAASEILDAWQPEVVILDIELPDGSGLALLRSIKHERPVTQVLMFSNHTCLRRRCEKEGADAFFDKGMESDVLADVVRSLSRAAA